MGLSTSKPEFVTVLADKQVKMGENTVLQCEANGEDVTAIWEKNGQKLDCVHGKTTTEQMGKSFVLVINNAEEGDEGLYTLKLKNKRGEASSSALVTIEQNEWRKVEWNQDGMIDALRAFRISHEKVETLQFLLYGPIGAGKSSIINTIRTIFKGRVFVNFLASSEKSGKSHTKCYEKCVIGNDGLLPFAFNDIKGLEGGHDDIMQTDVISALKGHVKEGYVFNPTSKLTEDSQYYLRTPSLNEKIHCLVNVIPADKISLMENEFTENIKKIREEASAMGLPQVIFMTRVDCICPLTKKNLRNIYRSRKIKEKMQMCSILLGVPVNCIFPVWNYHEETEINEEINCLMLHALTKIVHWADDYVVKCSDKQTDVKD